jgi:hypothetical protein
VVKFYQPHEHCARGPDELSLHKSLGISGCSNTLFAPCVLVAERSRRPPIQLSDFLGT